MARELGIGLGMAAFVLWLFFFGTTSAVEIATLVAVVTALIWFATVSPARLVDEGRRPHPLLFGLTGLGVALLFTSAVVFRTGTMFLIGSLGVAAVVVALVRAISWAIDGTGRNDAVR